MTLPSKERLLYLRDFVERNKEHANQNVGGPMSFSTYDTIALLDAAIALRRLETHMADPALRESYGHVTRIAARVQWGDMAPSWYVEVEGTESPRQHGNGPDLLAALTAALEKASAR